MHSIGTAPDVPDAMYRMKRIILLSLIGAATAAHTRPAVVVGPHEAVQKEFVLDVDPSTVAVSNEWQTTSEPRPFNERWRIVSDLNDDGVDDLILSDPNEASGNAGISWMVYLRDNGLWRYIGDVDLHPRAFTLEPTYAGVNIWNYWRNSCSDGWFGYYRVTNGRLGKKPMQIFIPDSGEKDSVFTRVYMAIFGCPHPHPFSLEKSTTSTNGIVSWEKIRDHRTPSHKNEFYELKQKLAEAEKRANTAEAKLREAAYQLYEYEQDVHRLCGITLGAAWAGGEKRHPCEEVFSGFTNLTVSVDGNNFVESIRLMRNDPLTDPSARSIRGGFEPTDEEQKIIHQVENHFNIRFQSRADSGLYSWGGPISGTYIDIHFARDGETESYIEMRYSRRLDK